jgi:glycosyltransferase involved in cell wall biosynthesis
VQAGRRGPDPSVSVVVPALNEADCLPEVIARLPVDVELVLVDGHSTDGTVELVRRLWPDPVVVVQPGRGKGDALSAGCTAATGDIIVTLDADGSADPREIPRFVEALVDGADYAKGSRFVAEGGSDDITRVRRWGNRFLTVLVNLLFGTRYTDLCYGFNAFWRDCVDDVAITVDGFEVETLMNIKGARAGLSISEVPSFEYDRISGQSNLRPVRDGLRVLRTIVRERVRRPRSTPPLEHHPLSVLRPQVELTATAGGPVRLLPHQHA